MWYWILLIAVSFAGGMVQTLTGFGAAIVMMCVLPYFMPLLEASALASSITIALVVSSSIRLRKYLDVKVFLLPGILYIGSYYLTLQFVQQLKAEIIEIIFGIFLIVLSIYYLFIGKKASMKNTTLNCVLCGVPSGVMAAFFGIGGPLMALLLLARTENRKVYIANLHAIFMASSVMGLITRFAKGIYTVELIPATVVGCAAILVANRLGNQIGDKMSPEKLKLSVYIFIGISGLITLLT